MSESARYLDLAISPVSTGPSAGVLTVAVSAGLVVRTVGVVLTFSVIVTDIRVVVRPGQDRGGDNQDNDGDHPSS